MRDEPTHVRCFDCGIMVPVGEWHRTPTHGMRPLTPREEEMLSEPIMFAPLQPPTGDAAFLAIRNGRFEPLVLSVDLSRPGADVAEWPPEPQGLTTPPGFIPADVPLIYGHHEPDPTRLACPNRRHPSGPWHDRGFAEGMRVLYGWKAWPFLTITEAFRVLRYGCACPLMPEGFRTLPGIVAEEDRRENDGE